MTTRHPRFDWTDVPAANSHAFSRALVRGTAVHWNGPPVPRSALTDPRSYLEGIRRFHVNGHGWSDVAYNFAVDQTGDIWTLRGMHFMSAANGDTRTNERYVAVLAIIGVGQHPTAAMKAGIKEVVHLVQAEYPMATVVTTHKAIRPEATACPGPDLIKWVATTDFSPRPSVSISDVRDAIRTGSPVHGGKLIKKALAAEVGRGQLDLTDGRLGRGARNRFRLYQRKVGVPVTKLPRRWILERLGRRHGFDVTD